MYEISQMFIYKPIFVIELLVAELLAGRGVPKRKHFWLRFLLSALLCIGVSMAIPQLYLNPVFNTFYYSIYFLFLFGLSLLLLYFSYSTSWKNVFLIGVFGYTIQHIAQETYQFLSISTGLYSVANVDFYSSGNVDFTTLNQNLGILFGVFFLYFSLFVLIYLAFYFVLRKRVHSEEQFKNGNVTLLLLVSLVLLLDILINSISIYMISPENNRLMVSLLDFYNVCSCLLSLTLLIEIPRRQRLETELVAVKQLRNKDKERYKVSKENIDLINIKCHDLKKQILHLSENGTLDQASLKEISDQVETYNSDLLTENNALNVVFYEESALCQKNGIHISGIIDGRLLSFTKDTDVYSLFLNLMDNAIEAVEKNQEGSREITLNVKREGDFIRIQEYNWSEKEVLFDHGIPQTTHADKNVHGFGMKSIRYIVEKYHGLLSISYRNHIFEVVIVFPVQK